jgi:hypothetical protein
VVLSPFIILVGSVPLAISERIASSLVAELPISIELTAIEVWRTVGPVGDWTRRCSGSTMTSRAER